MYFITKLTSKLNTVYIRRFFSLGLSVCLVLKKTTLSFLTFIFLVCGIKTIVANATTPADSVFTTDILSWITSTFVLTIVTQITATGLIAGRIYHASLLSIAGGSNKRHYMSLVWLVVESGAIYTSAALIQLITYLLKMNAGVIMEFMLCQLSVRISPSLSICQISLFIFFWPIGNGSHPHRCTCGAGTRA